MIYILYSADYEIYLGENFLPENEVLIKPTCELLDTCDQLDIPITLFSDVMCFWRYRELGLNRFSDEAEKQMQEAVKRGHDVQAHIHPHWPYANLIGKRWVFDPARFLLGEIFAGHQECRKMARRILNEAKNYLNGLLKSISSTYECSAFRAGGYGIQPQAREILAALEDCGYLIDSSICPGTVLGGSVNRIDFTEVPSAPNYFLSSDSGLNQPASRGIWEIPIATARLNFMDLFTVWIREKINQMLHKNLPTVRGKTIQTVTRESGKLKKLYNKITGYADRLKNPVIPLDLWDNVYAMVKITKRYLNQFECDGDIYFSFTCHPKGFTQNSLKALKEFHGVLKRSYGSRIKAISFQEIGKQLEKNYIVNKVK